MKTPEEIVNTARALAESQGREMTDPDLLVSYLRTRLLESHEQANESLGMWAKLALASPEQLRKWADEKEQALLVKK